MYYIYYNSQGSITTVANIIDETFGENFIEIDLETYTSFTNGEKQVFDYIVIPNSKIKGKMHIVAKSIEESAELIQPKGIINKGSYDNNAIIITQDKLNGSWSATSTIEDEICALFAQGEANISEYYIVDTANQYILLDTIQIDLKELAKLDHIDIKRFDKKVCKMSVNLLCNGHYVKHIHNIQE